MLILGVKFSIPSYALSRTEKSHQPQKVTASVSKTVPPTDGNTKCQKGINHQLKFSMDDQDEYTAPVLIHPTKLGS